MQIRGYTIEGELGRGGAAVVYRARAQDGRAVALKVLKPLDGPAAKRFERETRLASALGEEAGFVPIIESGVEKGAPFIAMPLVEGGTLRARLQRGGPLGVAETLALGRALARALGAAHARGIVHRDVKPENVLFTQGSAESGEGHGRPLLADLGLAKHFDRATPGASQSAAVSAHGAFLGTAGYMPGEQMRDALTVGPPADVFSLGCLLYECLTGRGPFDGATPLESITRVESGNYTRVHEVRAEVPGPFAAVIERAIRRDPTRRFADGDAFERALAGVSERRRTSRAAPVALGAVIVLLASAAVVLATREAPAPPMPAPQTPRVPAVIEPPAPVATVAPHVETAAELVAKARLCLRCGELDWAEWFARLAANLEPRNAEARAIRSYAWGASGDVASALAEAKEATSADERCALAWAARAYVDPSGDDALEMLRRADGLAAGDDFARAVVAEIEARVYRRAREMREALAAATRAVRIEPLLAMGHILRAECRIQLGETDVRDDLELAFKCGPGSPMVALARGSERYQRRDLDGALSELNRAIELSPRNAFAWRSRAGVKLARRDHRGSAHDATRALTLVPRDGLAWYARACAREHHGDKELAISDAARALKLGPGTEANPSEWLVKCLMLQITARLAFGADRRALRFDMNRVLAQPVLPAEDRKLIEEWLAKNPASSDPPAPADERSASRLVADGEAAYKRSDGDEVVTLASRAIGLDPQSSTAWWLRARGCLLQKRFQDAVADVTQALDLGSDPVKMLSLRSRAHDGLRDRRAALADGDEAIERVPDRWEAWTFRADIRQGAGDPRGAIADCVEAFRRPPGSIYAMRALGFSLADLGDLEGARQAFTRYLETNGDDAGAKRVRSWMEQNPRR